VPPGYGTGDDNLLWIPDNAFGFQLSPERNPDALGRIDFRGNAFGGHSNSGKVSEQILAGGASGEVLARVRGKRAETVLFQNGFEFVTPHTENSAGRSTGWLSLPECSKVLMRVMPSSTLYSF
jgi:hypothetical protein